MTKFVDFLKEGNNKLEEENGAIKGMLEEMEQQFLHRERAVEAVLEEQQRVGKKKYIGILI
jgi:hypothetical protein